MHPKVVLAVSPWLTQEEGAQVKELASALGVEALVVSPEPTGLKDDLLNTGDPAPNRRGLVEQGFLAQDPQQLLARMGEAESVLLIGERVVDLIGRDELAGLGHDLRVMVLDTVPYAGDNACTSLGVPNYFEREGTWINVDGKTGRLYVARPAPSGVAQLTRTLSQLLERCAEGASQS